MPNWLRILNNIKLLSLTNSRCKKTFNSLALNFFENKLANWFVESINIRLSKLRFWVASTRLTEVPHRWRCLGWHERTAGSVGSRKTKLRWVREIGIWTLVQRWHFSDNSLIALHDDRVCIHLQIQNKWNYLCLLAWAVQESGAALTSTSPIEEVLYKSLSEWVNACHIHLAYFYRNLAKIFC